MNVEEMIIGINLGVQQLDSNAYDNILPEEALYYLNKANREYGRRQTIYLKEEMKSNRHDFISDVEASNNLGSLLVNHLFENADLEDATEYDNAVKANLSDLTGSMFSYVYSQARLTDGGKWRACKLISSSEIGTYSRTEYNNPVFREYPIVRIGNYLYVFFDVTGNDVFEYNLVYFKSPSKLVTSEEPGEGEVNISEFPEHTHDDIVNLAVSMIMEDLKSARPYEKNQTTVKGEEV